MFIISSFIIAETICTEKSMKTNYDVVLLTDNLLLILSENYTQKSRHYEN